MNRSKIGYKLENRSEKNRRKLTPLIVGEKGEQFSVFDMFSNNISSSRLIIVHSLHHESNLWSHLTSTRRAPEAKEEERSTEKFQFPLSQRGGFLLPTVHFKTKIQFLQFNLCAFFLLFPGTPLYSLSISLSLRLHQCLLNPL